jgi:hypothetical protein
MTMMEEPPREQRRSMVTQMWIVSLGISVFCCAIFSALIAFYVSDLGKTLNTIDSRLANLEVRGSMMAPVVAPRQPPAVIDVPSAAPVVPETPPAPLPVETPSAAPAPVPEAPPAPPAPPSAPEAGAPEPLTPPESDSGTTPPTP